MDDMAWVTFTEDFDYQPSETHGLSTVAYKAGMTKSVRRECSDQAIAAGKAHQAPTPAQEAGRVPDAAVSG